MSFKVVVKKQGRWLIAAMRNATPAPHRPPFPGSFPGTSNPPASTPPQDAPRLAPTTDDANHAQDEAAIRKIVADGTDAWNRRDAKALAAGLTEDSDHIGANGGWTSGRFEIEKVLGVAHANSRENLTSAVQKIRFLSPDVAVIVVGRDYKEDDKATRKAISTLVFHNTKGKW